MPKEVLTAGEAAELLSVSVQTILRKARARQIPAARIGRQWRFSRSELLKWIEAGGEAATEPKMADDETDDFQRLSAEALQDTWENEEDAIYDNWRQAYGLEQG